MVRSSYNNLSAISHYSTPSRSGGYTLGGLAKSRFVRGATTWIAGRARAGAGSFAQSLYNQSVSAATAAAATAAYSALSGNSKASRTVTTMPGGVGGTQSFCQYSNRSSRLGYMKKTTSSVKYIQNSGINFTCGVGVQACTYFTTFSKGNIVTMFGETLDAADSRILFESCTGTLDIANCNLANAHLTIYDIVCKRDIGSDAAHLVDNPLAAWVDGSGVQVARVGAHPWESNGFSTLYKIIKTTRVVIGGGGVHQHMIKHKPNYVLDYQLGQEDSGYNGFKGLTVFQLIVVNGGPANDKTTKSTVSTGTASLNLIYALEYKYRQTAVSTSTVFANVTLPTSFPAGEEIITDVSRADNVVA